jgi:amino-acid N-acetyltransferase
MSAPLHCNHIRPEDSEEFQEALAEASLPPVEFGSCCSYRRYADEDGRTIGFGGIEGHGPDRLLRSLVVLPEFRGRGYGAEIARDLQSLAAEDGAARLHLLTIAAAPFFEKLGYEPRDRMNAPVDIAVTTEFTTLCPASARYLVKAIA